MVRYTSSPRSFLPGLYRKQWDSANKLDFESFIKLHGRGEFPSMESLLLSPAGDCLVNVVGWFEELKTEWAGLKVRFSLPEVLPRAINPARGPGLLNAMTKGAEQIIAETYAQDFKLFGYSLDPEKFRDTPIYFGVISEA